MDHRPRGTSSAAAPAAALALAFAVPVLADPPPDSRSPEPPAAWQSGFDDGLPPGASIEGNVALQVEGPRPPAFPEFTPDNQAIGFRGAGARIEVADTPALRFENGDAITIEAFVRLDGIGEGQNVYVAGKGRTHRDGFDADNQNYALRLRGRDGEGRISFLFRSAPGKDAGGAYHRWTSRAGIVPGSGWHHVMVAYRFGAPDSIAACVDGASVEGDWDMGGPTTAPPVTDGDALWIGSSMGGSAGNSLSGSVDDVRIHRRIIAPDEAAGRFVFVPQPDWLAAAAERPPSDHVRVEVFENGVPPGRAWPDQAITPDESYREEAFAFFRLPRKHDSEGLRARRAVPLLIRASARIELPRGRHRLLLRAHNASRVFVDGRLVIEIGFPRRFHDAHQSVPTEFLDLAPDLRFPAPGGLEKAVWIECDEGTHDVVLAAVVGQRSGDRMTRTELGETTLSVATAGDPSFTLVAPRRMIPHTDEAWALYAAERDAHFDLVDLRNRRSAAASRDGYWADRHRFARQVVQDRPSPVPPDVPQGLPVHNAIDRFIGARLETARASAIPATDALGPDFHRDVLPLLEARCLRCHGGARPKGGLALASRDALLAGGDSGDPAVVPGAAARSLMIGRIRSPDPDDVMPPKGDPLAPADTRILEEWIDAGAPWPEVADPDELEPGPPLDDLAFLRRATLDTVGVVPTEAEIRAFEADRRPGKRARAINRLLADPRWADHWTSYWQDVLAENPNILKPNLNNTGPFRWWIHESLLDDKPFDRFVTELVLMRGSQYDGAPRGFGVATQNDVPMAAKAVVIGSAFLGLQMQCARCHDAPYHDHTQAQLFSVAAMLERAPIEIPASSSVPLDRLARMPLITASLRPGDRVEPEWPFTRLAEDGLPERLHAPDDDDGRNGDTDTRARLAAEITSPHNRRFARVIVNRLWHRLMGRGIVEPVDDWENANPSHPGLLDHLADAFVAAGYDVKHTVRQIMNSHAYQRAAPPAAGTAISRFFTGRPARQFTAEQVVDSLFAATGNRMDVEEINFDVDIDNDVRNFLNLGRPSRAWQFASLSNERDRPSLALPRAQAIVDVLEAFGWRGSRQEPTSERQAEPNVLQPAILANGTMSGWVTRLTDGSGLTRLAVNAGSPEELVESLFLRLLTRRPGPDERSVFLDLLAPGFNERITSAPGSDGAPVPPAGRRPPRYIAWSNHLSPEANEIKLDLERRAREGAPPTRRLARDWRERMEDAVWSLVASPEFVHSP